MATQVSPGVVINEIDRSDSLTQVALTQAGIAGPFVWGPINEVVTVSSETQLVDSFGKPNSDTATTFFTGANFLAYSNTLRVVRSANSSAKNATVNGSGYLINNSSTYRESVESSPDTNGNFVTAKYAGVLGNSLRVEICSNASAFSITPAVGTINATVSAGNTVVTFSANAYSNVTGNVVVGDIITVGGQKRRIVTSTNGTSAIVNAAFTASYTGNTFTREWRYAGAFTGAPDTSSYVSERSGSGDEMHIVVVDEDGLITGTPYTVLERFERVSKAADARDSSGATSYYKNVLNDQSAWVWWTGHPTGGTNWGNNAAGVTFTSIAAITANSLSGGAAGETGSDKNTAYDQLANESVEVSFILGGELTATQANYVIGNVVEPRKYTMGFFSPEANDVVNVVGSEVTNILDFRTTLTSTSYAVLDSGWKYQYDKYNQVYRWVPLNGDVAGCAARTDQIAESWFSPAGFTRGQIKIGNTVKLAFNPKQADRDTLYVKGVNPVVSFPGEGTVLYGDKTLQSKPSAFDRINVRRLFIALEKTIERSAKYQLFEQNDEFTRNSFINLVEPFLRSVKGRRGISDFYVVCDETNNPQDAVDRNEFRADIYIKPIRSINFIQLNFVSVRSDVSFNEVISNLG